MSSPDQSLDVSPAYDRVADQWHASRGPLSALLRGLLDRTLAGLPMAPTVLDVGCGSGVPLTQELVARGCAVTGLDPSGALLAIAARTLPRVTWVQGDMRTAEPGGPFHAVVAWDSVFHLPRADHPAVFARFREWLRPAGRLLLSLGGSAWEGTSSMLGETFYYSGYDPEESLVLLRAADFRILDSFIDDASSRGHLAVLATAVSGRGHR